MNHLLKHLSRLGTLYRIFPAGRTSAAGAVITAFTILSTAALPLLSAPACSAQFLSIMQDSPAYLLHGNSQGYLGVTLHDVDNDRVVSLKLRDAKGAEVVTVDHDAPAGKAGLQAQDVILQMNGQTVESAEQLRHLLHEIPAGRIVNFVVSREGQQVTLSAKLADRKELEHEAWGQHVDPPASQQEMPILNFDQASGGSRGFVDGWSLGVGNFSAGAVVDPLGAQLASYFGVTEGVGLLVKSVDRKSHAQNAGLRAGDVVLKINEDTMATRADWMRVLRENQGRQVQVTVLRDKKQQQLSMQAGSSKKKSHLEMP